MPKRRPRLSLLNLLLLTAIAALSITVAQFWREVGPLRQEVRRLRDEVGELMVKDPTKLHAIRVPTENAYEWKWRVWLPEGRRYRIHVAVDDVPKEGFPEGDMDFSSLKTGEQVICYRIRRDDKGEWRGVFEPMGVGPIEVGSHPWVRAHDRVRGEGGVRYSTRVVEPDTPLSLIRCRVFDSSVDLTQRPEIAPEGFMIWLEPIP